MNIHNVAHRTQLYHYLYKPFDPTCPRQNPANSSVLVVEDAQIALDCSNGCFFEVAVVEMA